MSSTSLTSKFNDHFIEFIDDVQQVFPNDKDILTAKNALLTIKKTNPKMLVKIWKSFITDKYQQPIMEGNIQFFIEKDYANDVSQNSHSSQIMSSINRLREPIRNMGVENQQKAMKYIQNLTKLSLLIQD
jgi:hypothetical protein